MMYTVVSFKVHYRLPVDIVISCFDYVYKHNGLLDLAHVLLYCIGKRIRSRDV